MILVDTNVISEPMTKVPDARVIAWIDAQAIETLYLSAVTVAELRFGIAVLPAGKRRDKLRARLEDEVLPLFADRVLPFDLAASEAYARLMAQACKRGTAIGKADGFIAAIAASRSLAVATHDTAPFEAAGLAAIDPWQAAG
ncbi:type II toxin-antitoxin system VapC family toxin [Xanthobacter autotrophicus]|uniref:type II toxin-antitoxin system VapC family toxin n=1 Tax=Xanthobacter autotrophicus TaxID=280 RepID=UPI003727E6C3